MKKELKKILDKMCSWLFGESKRQQKKKLKKLLIWTAVLAIISFLLLFDGPMGAAIMGAIIILMWGWNFVSATAATVGRIINFFDNDMAIFVISLILWLFLGIIGGVISLVLGIIRFVQIREE